VNFVDSITIIIPSPLLFTVANRCMNPIDTGVAFPFIGVNESIILGKLVDMVF